MPSSNVQVLFVFEVVLIVIFHQRSSSIKCRLPSKVIFRQRSSSVKGRFPSKVVFRQMSSSIKCRLPSKVVFCQRSSSIKCLLPSKVVFRQHLLTAMPTLMPIYLFYSWLSCAHCLCCVYTCTVHCLWLYSCLVSESSNYELGRLDNEIIEKSVTHKQTNKQTDRQTDIYTRVFIELLRN